MKRTLLGMLTPSSNTVLEPVTCELLRDAPGTSAHFSRFRVTQITLGDRALAQFASPAVVEAARLLADARCDVIAWSGTSASWLGFDTDERLCQAIREATGTPACTSVLAINELLARTGARRIGLVTPYLDDVQARIVDTYAHAGLEIVAERHLGMSDNFSFSEVSAQQMTAMAREVAQSRPDAIVILCTNLRGAPLVPALEAELDIPVYDSVSAVVWKSLRLAGADPRVLSAWGRLFLQAD
jgi:maleate isomerase